MRKRLSGISSFANYFLSLSIENVVFQTKLEETGWSENIPRFLVLVVILEANWFLDIARILSCADRLNLPFNLRE